MDVLLEFELGAAGRKALSYSGLNCPNRVSLSMISDTTTTLKCSVQTTTVTMHPLLHCPMA